MPSTPLENVLASCDLVLTLIPCNPGPSEGVEAFTKDSVNASTCADMQHMENRILDEVCGVRLGQVTA